MQGIVAFIKPEMEFSVEINKINKGFGIEQIKGTVPNKGQIKGTVLFFS